MRQHQSRSAEWMALPAAGHRGRETPIKHGARQMSVIHSATGRRAFQDDAHKHEEQQDDEE